MNKFIITMAVGMFVFSTTSAALFWHDTGRFPGSRQEIGSWLYATVRGQ